MNLTDVRAAYYEFSGKTSDIARTLSLTGLAVIWIFKSDATDGPHVPNVLITPAFLLVLALILDFLHYVVATVVWGSYARYKERRNTAEDAAFTAPAWFNWPTTFFLFPLKVIAVWSGYTLLLQFLWQRLH